MKKSIVVLAAGLALAPAFAQTAVPQPQSKDEPKAVRPTKAMREAYMMMRFGGRLKDTREQKGRAVIVRAAKAVDTAWLASVAKYFADQLHIAVEVADGEFDLANPVLKGEASLFVIDNPALPMSLVAPEAKWSMVNVAKLKTEKAAFFESRVKKMTTRGLAYALGTGDSQYPMCLTGFVTKPEDLDKFMDTRLPMDVLGRITKYAASCGITPYKMTTYKKAVVEGWAHSPTNEDQKAIWDEIHTLPTKPITIEPEKK